MEHGATGSSAATGGARGTVFIRTITGDLVGAVDVCWDDTGADLKRKVIDDVDELTLIFAGKCLEDARSLRHQGLTNHCTVHAVTRLRGGDLSALSPGEQLEHARSQRHQGTTDHWIVQAMRNLWGGGDINALPPGEQLEHARSQRHQGPTDHWIVQAMRNFFHFPAVTAQGREGAQPHSSSPDKAEPEEQTREARRAVAACRYSAMLTRKCKKCVGEILPEVTPEIVPGTEENRTVYRARIPSAGSFHCSETGLGFEVSAAVTVEYEYGSWAESLSPSARQEWMVAGPLFHIRAEPNTVRAVHLPHFVCLADGADESLCHIAHFEAGRMTLESPSRINNFFAVLENPSFSQLGVLWRKIRSAIKFIPIHSLVLIFRTLSAADVTLHLYLIPNDHSLRKAIEEEEMKWKSKHVPKPPQTDPLYFGSRYQVSGPSDLEITPTQLHFCYRSPVEQQSYIEIYTKELEKEIRLHVNGQDDGSLVWEALVRPGDVSLSALSSQTLTGAAFVVKHRRQLRARMGQIQPVLERLREAQLLSSEEEEEVRSEQTSHMRNDALLQLVERKGAQAQEELYQTLRETDPFLVQDLEQSS